MAFFEGIEEIDPPIHNYGATSNVAWTDQKKEYIDIKESLGILHFIMEEDRVMGRMENVLSCFKNENCVLLVIEDMCLGIIMIDHHAMKFKYIENLFKRDGCDHLVKYPIKIARISKEWDTAGWSYQKLQKIYYNHLFETIENITMEQLEEHLKTQEWKKYKIDVHFLLALSWDGSVILEI